MCDLLVTRKSKYNLRNFQTLEHKTNINNWKREYFRAGDLKYGT